MSVMQRFRWTTIHVVFLYICGVLLGANLVNLLLGKTSILGGVLGLIVAAGLPVLPALHATRRQGHETHEEKKCVSPDSLLPD
jgi:hypothetical protein